MAKKKTKAYPESFRKEAVRLADLPDRTAADVARELGIHVGQIYNWRTQFNKMNYIMINIKKSLITVSTPTPLPALVCRRGVPRFICSVLFVVALATYGSAMAKPDPVKWLAEAEAAYDRVESYTALFHKQQRIGDELLDEEDIFLKCRKRPFSLYMKWVTEPYEGSELLYVEGWNDGRIRAHRGGILSLFVRNLDPNDSGLLEKDLRPATSTGVGYLLDTVARNMRKAIKAGELTFIEREKELVYGRDTQIFEVDLLSGDAKDYDGARFIINQDVESKILLRIRVYDLDGRLVENYGYENLKLDAHLSVIDFDSRNPEYDF
jgi:transposase-like protein